MRIGRYNNPHKCVSFDTIDTAVRAEPVALEAADGALSNAILYERAPSKTVVCFMHPQANMSRHYAIPAFVEAGYATFGQNSRYLNNDTHCIHELLLLDVAAGLRFLRERGYQSIVLIGNSGGGSLYTFYQSQATSGERLGQTPAGDRLDLSAHELPAADGLVLLAAHLGEGEILKQMIDPSVCDESDPTSCDASLDPYDPTNGFRLPPESSHYPADFVQRYRDAQQDRVQRIDDRARALLRERDEARHAMGAKEFTDRPWAEKAAVSRRAVAHPPMVVHRTEADLRALDTSLDPSARDAGTLFSYRPDLTNYMELGFARVTTPKAWLSTWSGLSSNASLVRTAPAIDIPALVVGYDGDNAIFPGDTKRSFDLLGSSDKTIESAPGDHYGFGVGKQQRTGAPVATAKIVEWLKARFPRS